MSMSEETLKNLMSLRGKGILSLAVVEGMVYNQEIGDYIVTFELEMVPAFNRWGKYGEDVDTTEVTVKGNEIRTELKPMLKQGNVFTVFHNEGLDIAVFSYEPEETERRYEYLKSIE